MSEEFASSEETSFNSFVLPSIAGIHDKRFVDTLYNYIEKEKEKLKCPQNVPDEQRYTIYSFAFDKVIEQATTYKRILTCIKQEYDDCIRALKEGGRDERFSHGKMRATAAEPTTLMNYKQRAAELQKRIEIITQDSDQIEAQIVVVREKKKNESNIMEKNEAKRREIKPFVQIPGLNIKDSLNPDILDKYLETLQSILKEMQEKRKNQYAPRKVKVDLDCKLTSILEHADRIAADTGKCQLKYELMTILDDAVGSWKRSDKNLAFLNYMLPVLTYAFEIKGGYSRWTDLGGFHEGHRRSFSDHLVEYIDRFNELFEEGQYEAAASHAAKSPLKILWNTKIRKKFTGAIVEESNLPPLLLFFKSVMRCEASDTHTPNEEICLEAVMVALKYNKLELVEQWITQQRLIITEALTDQIYKYGENNPEVTHTCLTLAQEAYRCCKVNKKAVLCMCKRGRVYEAVRYIHQCKAFSQEDFLYLVQHCHSAEVLHSLTQKLDGKQAPMSLGCMVLSLMSENKWNCCLQLLKEFSAFGKDTLEQAILADELCTPEGWIEIARKCQEHNWGQLAHEIISILSAQGGVVDLSVCSDDAILMEHVFL
ncbi:clathrin heavy chain linker domain-containing protein 1-like isoform X2 [Erpetoichthys calabaricus]|uniref:clathrin heavy chain linker domain-containing protein 1-like isoform X2 n=1 Tax=Erpetoichthys calabaricus TaxID=27687 RepID=UPI00223414DF|nr:clathrin heavy chain linker domain-containing protein 1-like isoform X2 [Erpetoichthys calabaricus]